jgi:protein-tyrosine-phosphatase
VAEVLSKGFDAKLLLKDAPEELDVSDPEGKHDEYATRTISEIRHHCFNLIHSFYNVHLKGLSQQFEAR